MIQCQLPDSMSECLEEIKDYRNKNSEPTTTKSIMIDALKIMRSSLKASNKINAGAVDG